MAHSFGKTWWGGHWLHSLNNIDYSNRLPRGASYARSGHVKEVKINENQIAASVSGSRPSPYEVSIIVPSFSDGQVELLMSGIISRPALISKLLNRELDPEIPAIAKEVGLKVFPEQWTDLKMQCSCPDGAVPCKHLASVIYMISREIDNNPFLVFGIHGVNLIGELKKRGIFIADQKQSEPVKLTDLLKPAKEKKLDFDPERTYQRIDFSQLHNIVEPIIQLLPDAPPFYPGKNFKDKYALQFTRIAKEARRIFAKNLSLAPLFPVAKNIAPFNVRSTVRVITDGNGESRISGENHNCTEMAQLIPLLFQLNPGHLPDYQPSVAALHNVL